MCVRVYMCVCIFLSRNFVSCDGSGVCLVGVVVVMVA